LPFFVSHKKERDWNCSSNLALLLITSHLEALDLWEKLNLYMAASRRNLEEHELKRRKGPKGNFGGALCQAGNVKGFGVSMGFEAEIELMEGVFKKKNTFEKHMSWKTYFIQT